jgi:hypothetical protein
MFYGKMSGGFVLGLWIGLFLMGWLVYRSNRSDVVTSEDIKEFLDSTQVQQGGPSERR